MKARRRRAFGKGGALASSKCGGRSLPHLEESEIWRQRGARAPNFATPAGGGAGGPAPEAPRPRPARNFRNSPYPSLARYVPGRTGTLRYVTVRYGTLRYVTVRYSRNVPVTYGTLSVPYVTKLIVIESFFSKIFKIQFFKFIFKILIFFENFQKFSKFF